jgi:hypothetical protein
LRSSLPISLLAILLLAAAINAQNWPDRIAGYKLHDPKITITGTSGDGVAVKVLGTKIKSIGLTGTTVEIDAEILSTKAGARIDFVTFKDVRVNGMAVEPQEYRKRFVIKKGESLKLPAPLQLLVPITSHPTAIYNQLANPASRLKITGTAFVFGKFKRFGIGFKRVAPVKLDLDIENPIRLR